MGRLKLTKTRPNPCLRLRGRTPQNDHPEAQITTPWRKIATFQTKRLRSETTRSSAKAADVRRDARKQVMQIAHCEPSLPARQLLSPASGKRMLTPRPLATTTTGTLLLWEPKGPEVNQGPHKGHLQKGDSSRPRWPSCWKRGRIPSWRPRVVWR